MCHVTGWVLKLNRSYEAWHVPHLPNIVHALLNTAIVSLIQVDWLSHRAPKLWNLIWQYWWKTTMPSSGLEWWMLHHEEPKAIGMLAPIPHFIWVNGIDLTSLGHNLYTMIPSIQTTEHPDCGIRFGNNHRPPWDPQGSEYWYMKNYIPWICYRPFPFHLLCVLGQGLTSLGPN